MSIYLDKASEFDIPPAELSRIIAQALVEDLGGGLDVTSTSIIDEGSISRANFVARTGGIVAGIYVAAATLESCNVKDIKVNFTEGAEIKAGQSVLEVRGNTRAILLAERTALNFLTHLSGIATQTKLWVELVKGTGAEIRDTRKTTPGLRSLEKFAVRMGGGVNHRMNLFEEGLIKDNHIFAAGDIKSAARAFKKNYPKKNLEVEIDNLSQLTDAISSDADIIMLDNFSLADCKKAIAQINGAKKIEVSGGITLENVRDFAETGVNFIAIGAITHSAPALDIGLDFIKEQ
jgi:nicotinate-nucleotide pyrophosphorylase (carboxylating)